MATISITTPSDGQTIDGSDVATPLNTIVTEINGNLDSNNIAEGGVVPNSLVDGTGTSWAWQSWTPSFTNFTLGNGTIDYAKYTQIGKTVHLRLKVTLGSTSSVSGLIAFSPPVTINAEYDDSLVDELGGSVQFRSGVSIGGVGLWTTGGSISLRVQAIVSSQVQYGSTSATVPFTWGTGNQILAHLTYEAA